MRNYDIDNIMHILNTDQSVVFSIDTDCHMFPIDAFVWGRDTEREREFCVEG